MPFSQMENLGECKLTLIEFLLDALTCCLSP